MSADQQAVKGDVQAALEAARVADVITLDGDIRDGYVVLADADGEQTLIVPEDHPAAETPRALKSAAAFRLLSELGEYVDEHGTNARVFVSAGSDGTVDVDAHLDFPLVADQVEHWGRHRARARIALSANAKQWLAGWSGTQKALAELLADLGADIVEAPDAQQAAIVLDTFGLRVSGRTALLVAVRQLKVTTTQEVLETQDLTDGTSTIMFKNANGGTSVSVPEAVLVRLEDEEQQLHVHCAVAVRYEVREGRLAWTLKPMGVATVRRAFRLAVAAALQGPGRTVVHGTAETTPL